MEISLSWSVPFTRRGYTIANPSNIPVGSPIRGFVKRQCGNASPANSAYPFRIEAEWSNNSDDCVGGGCPPRSHSPREWNRCKQRPTETQVSNITHCGIGHFQAPNIARDTFLAVTHVLWLPKTQSELETRKSCLHADTLCRRN